jgi:hypothetical protein
VLGAYRDPHDLVAGLHLALFHNTEEFVAARDDEQGVLILSDFAGASRELSEALIVNPYDLQSMSEAIAQALRMSETEQRDRMRLMRDVVRSRNVYRWAGQMPLDASQLRKRQKIMIMTSQKSKGRSSRVGWGDRVRFDDRTIWYPPSEGSQKGPTTHVGQLVSPKRSGVLHTIHLAPCAPRADFAVEIFRTMWGATTALPFLR